MSRIILSNGGVALVDNTDYIRLSRYTWRLDRYGYATRVGRINGKLKTIFMHREILKAKEIDHINGNRLDNRSSNLRSCTRSQNNVNSKVRVDNSCGFKGVCLHREGKWRAYVTLNGKQITLGLFSYIEEAIGARYTAEVEYYGEFSRV